MNYFVVSTNDYFYFVNRSKGYICNVTEVFYKLFDYTLTHNDSEVIAFYNSKYGITEIQNTIKQIRYYQKKGLCTTVKNHELSVSRVYTKDSLINNFHKCEQLLLQVTEACQFDCKYCFYGKMYNTNSLQPNKMMPLETAMTIVKERLDIWNRLGSISEIKKFYIGFYGGEPLLNFNLIEKVVKYVNNHKKNIQIQFNLTTNAYLLKKYIDFFIENDFEILISLDGDRKANQNRILKNGKETFDEVINCCNAIMKKNNDYFSKRIFFNSVFTTKSSLKDVISFFYTKYEKYPILTTINSFGVQKEEQKLFDSLYANLLQETHYFLLDNKSFYEKENNAINDQILDFFRNNDLDYFESFPGSITRRTDAIRNGTCSPFFKKIYIDVDGNILPCEKLYKNVVLGKVKHESIVIDYDYLVDSFNSLISTSSELCKHCFNATSCNQCLYSCFDNNKCMFFTNFNQGLEKTASIFKLLEFHKESFNYYME